MRPVLKTFSNQLSVGLLTLVLLSACQKSPVNANRPVQQPSGFMNETILKAALWLGMVDLIEVDPEIPADIESFTNIEYKNIDSISLQMDIYRPKVSDKPLPLIFFIHGGAWRGGKRGDYLPYLIDYVHKGYVVATVSYRLVRQALFPAAVQDVNCALQWLATNAGTYGIDPERIALLGGSAGGHLAMMVGYGGQDPLFNQDCEKMSPVKVKAVVNFYGPVDLTTPYSVGTYQVKDFLGTTYDENPQIYHSASPRTYISGDDPPTLTFHGTIDSLVPVSQADSLDLWLHQAGVTHEYHRLKGWPHAMDMSVKVNEYSQYYIDRFLAQHL